ncbi:MAG TPA: ABC transporter ATP-binding protein [Actinophytocola sp.]|nr:ABC transporter ATP-binding protein [Actinophytocola sp.]
MAAEASAAVDQPAINIKGLVKSFRRIDGTTVTPVDDVTLEIGAGSFVVLLGPSGCGKTTLLRCIAGLENPDGGEIEMGGRTVFSSSAGIDVPTHKRRVGMVFQSYALWPHMTVRENVAYPLQSRKSVRAEVTRAVDDALALVGVAELAGQYPAQLSGGQQQRVALARAVAPRNQVILFDEPLSNVDAKVREHLRVELLQLQRALGFTAIYVTHDQAEAMVLGERIAVLRTGKIAQYGAPKEVYGRPMSRYVADFIGTANEVAGKVRRVRGTEVVLDTAVGPVEGVAHDGWLADGQDAVAVIRPEKAVLTAEPAGVNCWPATVAHSVFFGPYTEHYTTIGAALEFRVSTADSADARAGQCWVSVAREDVFVLPANDDSPRPAAHPERLLAPS